jgi:tetratricopeptide (TPR) repeat protein
MLPEELKRVIAKPAERLGVHFEPGLVERILKDVEREPGGLPLLEFTLTRLWQAQEAGVIRNDKYQDDTLKQSISNRADELLARLTSGERELAMRGMTRLVRVVDASEEGSDTRQRVRLSQLGEATRRALEPFVEARLLVVDRHLATGEETIEVAHEALLRTWTALSKRLGQEREFLLWRQGLGPFLETWQQAPQKSEALLPGFRLEEAGGYLKSREQDLNEDERTFVRESLRRKKASRRARAWVLGLGGGLAGTALVAAVSYWGWTRSEGYQLREMARFPVDAVASDPKQDSAVLPWVEVLIQVGKPREALEAAFKLKSTVRRGDALFLAAKQLSLAGDTEAARRALEAALPFTVALEDMHGEAITEVVRRLASSNKPVALEFMSPWLKKENAWQGVAFHLAEARGLMRSGDTVRAREALDKAITRLRNAADAQLWNDIIIQGELLPTLGATASELGHQAPLKTALLYAAGRIPTPKRTQGGITALLSLARGLAALGEYTSSSDLLQKTLHDTQGWSSLESDWVRQTVEQGARAGESAPLLSLARTIKSSRFALDIAIGLLRAGKNEGVAALLDELEVLRKPAEYPFFEDADSLVGAIHALAKGGARDKARELLPNAIARCVSAGVGQLWTSTEEEVVWTVLELEEVEQVLMYTNMHIGSLKWGAFDEDTPKIDDPAWLLREALVQLARAGKADEALRSGERIGNTLVRAAVRARIAVVMAKQGRAQEASVLLRESLKELGKPEYSNEDVADAKNAFLHELASGLVEVGAIDEARESLRVMNAYDRSAGRAALMEALTQKVGPRDAFKFLTEEAALDDVIYSKALADFISAASKSDEARAALEVLPPDGWNKMHGDDRCRAGTELARWHARTGDIRSARLAVNQFCTQDDKVLQAYTTVLAEHVKRSRPAADGRTPD